jgi:hypothetical protein
MYCGVNIISCGVNVMSCGVNIMYCGVNVISWSVNIMSYSIIVTSQKTKDRATQTLLKIEDETQVFRNVDTYKWKIHNGTI